MASALRSRCAGLVLVLLFAPATAAAQGISAQLSSAFAVAGVDYVARLEVTDDLGAVGRVEVDVRPRGAAAWITAEAAVVERAGPRLVFEAAFPWARLSEGAVAGHLELRARLLGARGGLLLEIGDLDPLEIEVLTPPEAESRRRVFARARPAPVVEDDFTLTGHVALDGRAAASARARAFIGVGAPLTPRLAVIFGVAVGPAFARPEVLEAGGPMVLGFEGALRAYGQPPEDAWALFLEPFALVDVRLPGVDPGVGLRAGGSWRLGPELAFEASLGGAAMLFRASDPDERSSELGFTGGLRAGLRLGGRPSGGGQAP